MKGGRSILFALIALCGVIPEVEAQSRHAVFMHGLAGSGGDWLATVNRLKSDVRILPHLPELPWREKYTSQAKYLQSRLELTGLPSNVVLVGHSNGGIVSREWSRLRNVGGIVTIGTPHRGAPIIANLPGWAAFSGTTSGLATRAANLLLLDAEWSWVFNVVRESLQFATTFSGWSLTRLISVLGGGTAVPVATQMVPGSSYLSDLNSGTNLSRESGQIAGRVGIVTVAENFYFAGVARGISPGNANAIAGTMYASISTLLFWGNHILVTAHPTDTRAIAKGLALIELANQIGAIDPIYCRMVSSADMSACLQNDGIVPITSQAYPGAPNMLIEGPAHREQRDADDALYTALVRYAHVPSKSGVPPDPVSPSPSPPPPPPSDPDPPSPDDGTGSHDAVIIPNGILHPGDELRPDDQIRSHDERFRLIYQLDGNLVLYDDRDRPLWATGTDGTRPGVVVMQHDGNLVLYDASNRARWWSDTYRPGSWLFVQNDGNLVIYDADERPLWDTGTWGQ